MKAWQVSDKGDYDYIVFAETRGKAKAFGANEFDMYFTDVRVKRKRKYDIYAERGRVPVEVLLEDDWWVECCSCYSRVTKEDILRGGLINEESVYCPDCARELSSTKQEGKP